MNIQQSFGLVNFCACLYCGEISNDGGTGGNRIFSAGAGVSFELSGVTLTGGNGLGAVDSGTGGAVHTLGDLTLDGLNITANDAGSCGGAVSVATGTHGNSGV